MIQTKATQERVGEADGHHDTAVALADAGFVVAAISHGDNFQDLSRQEHLSAFATHPVDLRRLVDFMMSSWAGRASVDENRGRNGTVTAQEPSAPSPRRGRRPRVGRTRGRAR